MKVTDRRGGLEYLRMYPRLAKWMNQCVTCQTTGYKPELPNTISPGVAAETLREFFIELPVDDTGRCRQCTIRAGERE